MNFIDILQEHSISYRTSGQRCRPGWIQIDCPFCSPGAGKYYMGYNIADAYVNCWYCGFHGLTKTVAELLQTNYKNALTLTNTIDRNKRTADIKLKGKLDIPPGLEDVTGNVFKRYLKKRKYNTKQMVRLWKIQQLGVRGGHLSWRLFIPIHFHGHVVSWTTRSVSNAGVRYISASPKQELLPHKDLLYGEDYCRHACIVCEGPLDVWRMGPGAVATFGTSLSTAQVRKIAKYPIRAICYDQEPTAQRQARKLADSLSMFPGDTYNIQLDSADPGEASFEEVKNLRKYLKM